MTGTPHKPPWRSWRPCDIDDALLKDLTRRIKKGVAPRIAARALGIPPSTFTRWMRDGEQQVSDAIETGERHYALEREATLYLAVGFATGALAEELAGNIKAGHEATRGHEWLLAKLEPEEYGSTERVDITVGGSGVPLAVEGRAVVGLADVVRLALETGQGHLLGLDVAGDARGLLPAAGDVLPDPADGEPAAGDVPAAERD